MLCPQRIGTKQLALKLQSPSSVIIPSSLEGEERWVGECQFLHRKKELPNPLEQPIMLCHGARANLGYTEQPIMLCHGARANPGYTKHLNSVKSVLKNVFKGQKASNMNKNSYLSQATQKFCTILSIISRFNLSCQIVFCGSPP